MMNDECHSDSDYRHPNGIFRYLLPSCGMTKRFEPYLFATLVTILLRATNVSTTKVIIYLRATFVANTLYIWIYVTMNVVGANA